MVENVSSVNVNADVISAAIIISATIFGTGFMLALGLAKIAVDIKAELHRIVNRTLCDDFDCLDCEPKE